MATMFEEKDADSERGEWVSDDTDEDDFVEAKDNKIEVQGVEVLLKPYTGMEFDSEVGVRRFYNEYAKRVGFLVRNMQHRRSEMDGGTLARRLGCNNQNPKGKSVLEEKIHEGCKAALQFNKVENSGKWVVTRFVEEHNHPLVVSVHRQTNLRDKEKRVQELAQELHRHEELSVTYRESLIDLLGNVEKQSEHMSWKVRAVVQNVRKAEAQALTFSAA